MKKSLYTTLMLLFITTGLLNAQIMKEPSAQGQIKDLLLKTNVKESCVKIKDLLVFVDPIRDNIRYYNFTKPGTQDTITVMGLNNVFCISSNVKIPMMNEYTSQKTETNDGSSLYMVLLNGKRARLEAGECAKIILTHFSLAELSNEPAEDEAANNNLILSSEQRFLNWQYVDLLKRQNTLLSERTTAICLSLGGSFLVGVASSLENTGASSDLVNVFGYTGAVMGLVGGVWMLVNEFQLIQSRKKINNHLILRYGPNGIALQF